MMRHGRKLVLGFAALVAAASVAVPSATLMAKKAHLHHEEAQEVAASADSDLQKNAGEALQLKNTPYTVSGEDNPDVCFHFNQLLDDQPGVHMADFVHSEGGEALAVRASSGDLCVGGLSYGKTYTLKLLAGLPSQSGRKLEADRSFSVVLADRAASLVLAGNGFLLARDASNGVAIQTVNIEHVKVFVLRMSDRLLPSRLDSQTYFNRFGNDTGGKKPALASALAIQQESHWELTNLLMNTAGVVWSGTMDIENQPNKTIQTAFPLSKVIEPGKTGAYLVLVEDAAKSKLDAVIKDPSIANKPGFDYFHMDWGTSIAAHWIINTDIALTAMTGEDGLHVVARSLASAETLAGLKVSLISTGQDVLGEATTDAGGTATFPAGLMRGQWANAPAAIVAYGAKNDFTVMSLNRPAFDFSDRGAGGRPEAGPVEAFLYADRGIYRPGETVETMALVRDRSGKPVENMPVTFILRRPDGVETRRVTIPGAPQAGFHLPLPLSRSAARGLWTIEAFIDPTGAPIGALKVDVQDFVPQQLKVAASSPVKSAGNGDAVALILDGRYLYGAPAAGLHAVADVRLERDPEPVRGAPGYRFGLADETFKDNAVDIDLPDADEKGHVEGTHTLVVDSSISVPVRAVFSLGLAEPSGRVVADTVTIPVHTRPVLIGVKPRFADDRVGYGKDADFDVRVFDDKGTPVARHLRWRLIREDRIFDWFTRGDNWNWHFHIVDQQVDSGVIEVGADGTGTALTQHVQWGTYRLILSDADAKASTSIRFSSGWGATSENPETPDKVEVTAEKASVAAGETARLHIQGPFAGQAQVTVANGRVYETHSYAVPAEGRTIEVKAGENWGAGAYVLVSMYRPLSQGRPHDPVRATGLAWLSLDAASKTLSVKIASEEKVLPNRTITVPVSVKGAGGSAWLTLAAVDEGILQLTRFRSPDPNDFFFGKRRFGLDVRDDYGQLLDGSANAGAIHQGGDAGGEVGGPSLPVASHKTVALFSGPVEIGADGNANVKLEVPDFAGELRLMAVAYGRGAVGHAESHMVVRDPVVMDVALPRFMAPGDQADLAINLHNVDGAAGAYHLNLTAQGPVALAQDRPLEVNLGKGEQKFDHVGIRATEDGVATIDADLTGPNGFKQHRQWQIASRSQSFPETTETADLQQPGSSYRIDPAVLDRFVPGSVTVSLNYSGAEGIDVPGLLQSLYTYPYGCTEQLSSSAFPLLYYNDESLLGSKLAGPRDKGVKDRVQSAIDSIVDRQDDQGEFGLWRVGDGLSSPWLNVYALDFLIHAKEAGFTVPNATLERGYRWIGQRAQLNSNMGGVYGRGAQTTFAHAQYVLARTGRADIGELRRVLGGIKWDLSETGGVVKQSVYWSTGKNRDQLAEPLALAQIAAAFSMSGDATNAKAAMDLAVANLGITDHPHWWFDLGYYSEQRDLAGLIAIAAEIGDTATALDLIGRYKVHKTDYSPYRWYNTQEKAWLLLAAHRLNADASAVSFDVNGTHQDRGKLPASFAPTPADIAKGYQVTLGGDRPLWRSLVVRGVPKVQPPAKSEGYHLNKTYTALDGSSVDITKLKQNDRFIVILDGSSNDKLLRHTVVADLLPPGWEIESVLHTDRSKGDEGPLANLTRAGLAEARDDRFVAAFQLGDDETGRHYVLPNDGNDLEDNEFRFAYVVRVVTPGKFLVPGAAIEDMYDATVSARTESGSTEVGKR